jgi:hypothetical protein
MNSWIKEIKEAAKYDTEYTKKYGELILYNMFQELEYLRLIYFAKDFDYGNEIDQVIAIYKIDVQMCRLMEMPKYRKMIKEYQINKDIIGQPKPLFGMRSFYDGRTWSEVKSILGKYKALENALLN